MLAEAARRVSDLTRTGDVLARQGGDEFLLLLGSGGDEDPRRAAQTAGERIAAALDEPFEISDALFHVGASIGVALYPEHASDADTLFKHADHAMYQAKRRGGGTVAFYEAEATDARERLSLTSRLRRAIREGELRLHVQPIVDVQDSRIVAVEALVRWQDPEHGLIPPAMFIGVAEETGLIDGIGDWVLEALCAHGALWREQGFEPLLTFNVSPRQLRRRRPRRVDPRAHRALRPRARPLLRGADGERDPQRRARAPHDALATSPTPAWPSPSTTSAPATPRSDASATCPSRCSRSTAASSSACPTTRARRRSSPPCSCWARRSGRRRSSRASRSRSSSSTCAATARRSPRASSSGTRCPAEDLMPVAR